ncbi:MAG: hypothetical protein H7A40_04610 [Chlamydiales bacterium]|nr:hypothetical protein [Chlamydiales bacterium]
MPNVGLHIDQNTIYLALIKKAKNGLKVDLVKKIDSSAALLSSDFIGRQTELTTGLSVKDVLMRSFDMPLCKKRALKQALPFQLESQFPYPINELIILTTFTPVDKSTTHIHALATHTKTIESHLKKLQNLGLSAHWVSSHAVALERYVAHFYPKLDPYIAIFVAPSETLLIAKNQGQIVGTTAFSIGTATLEQATDPSDVRARFSYELDRSIHFLKSKCKAALHWQILTLGSADDLVNDQIEGSDMILVKERIEKSYARYAIAIGLGLDTAMKDEKTCQFRQGSYTSSHHLGKLGKKLCLTFFLSALLALTSQITTSALLKSNAKNIEKYITSFIESSNHLNSNDLAFCHESDVQKRLDYKIGQLKAYLRKQKGFFPVNLEIPAVTEILAYLSTHPIFSDPTHGIEISSLHYELDTYPTLNHINTRYDGTLSLELSIPSPTSATLLIDTLKTDTTLIDTQRDIDFQRTGAGYTLTCHLKRSNR